MKPPPFEYDDPGSVTDTLALLAEHGDEAKVLAGGQSLVPLMNFRLARPERLIDVNGVDELDYLRLDGGTLRIGAITRQAALERSPEVAERVPLLREAVRLVGHVQIRNRGTVGGSVAHADPAAELPVAFAALDARFRARSTRGERELGSEDLFVTHLTTTLAADELLTEIEVPLPPPRTGAAFVEFARRHGDFALGGAAVLVTLGSDGTCERASIALLAAAPTPLRRPEVERWLSGVRIEERTAAEAAERSVVDVNPTGDIHGGSEYRRRLVEAMVRRALLQAAERAKEGA
jgi:carbon-monoxide dehydrogenase medium subunit/6-hydroxypseudooxynicotine dehydrogenase subunit alpha